MFRVLDRQLRLTSEQRERIDQIMADGQERMRELRARIEPQMRKELQETREQIRAVLTPEQREQFEQLMKQRTRAGTNAGECPGQPNGASAISATPAASGRRTAEADRANRNPRPNHRIRESRHRVRPGKSNVRLRPGTVRQRSDWLGRHRTLALVSAVRPRVAQ